MLRSVKRRVTDQGLPDRPVQARTSATNCIGKIRLVQCAQWLSHITLLFRVGWQRRMVEISLSGVTGGDRVYGLWSGLRHRRHPERGR